MTSYHDQASLSRYGHALAAGLRCEPAGPSVYRVESESHRGRWYVVRLGEDGYTCNCPATVGCKHGCRAAAEAFPSLLELWRVEAECREIERQCEESLAKIQRGREERHKAECAAWRKTLEPARLVAQAETDEVVARFRRRQREWEEYRGGPVLGLLAAYVEAKGLEASV